MSNSERFTSGVDFDLLQAWNEIWRYKAIVVSIAMVVTAVAVAFAFLVTPIYRVTTLLLPADESSVSGAMRGLGDLGTLATIAGLGSGSGDMSIEAEAILKSRKFAEDFIRERDLLPTLFADDWDAEGARWNVSGDDVPKISDGFLRFDRKVRRVSKDRKSGLVALSIEWSDPEVAADWANDLVRRLNETMRARALLESAATIAEVERQIAETRIAPLQKSLAELLESQMKRQTFARVRSEFALRVIDPAVVPGLKEQVFPRRGAVVASGLAVGFGLGIFVAVILGQVRRRGTGEFATSVA